MLFVGLWTIFLVNQKTMVAGTLNAKGSSLGGLCGLFLHCVCLVACVAFFLHCVCLMASVCVLGGLCGLFSFYVCLVACMAFFCTVCAWWPVRPVLIFFILRAFFLHTVGVCICRQSVFIFGFLSWLIKFGVFLLKVPRVGS